MDIKVIHSKRSALKLPKEQIVHLDRTIGKSKLANQWTHLRLGNTKATYQTQTVQEAVDKYEEWLKTTVHAESTQSDKPIGSLLRVVYTIGKRLHIQGKTLYLACWCKDELDPKPYDHVCHCDVVRRILVTRFNKENP